MSRIRSNEACAAAIAELGALDRSIAAIQARLDERVAAVKAEAEAESQPLQAARDELAARIEHYCNDRRAGLTEFGLSKSATFTTGEIGWRLGQAKLEVEPAKLGAVIAAIERLGLEHMLRRKVDLDRRAIVKQFEAVKHLKGLKLHPAAESFWIAPVAIDLAPAP